MSAAGPEERRRRGDRQGRTIVGGPRSRAWFARLLAVSPDAGEGTTRVTAAGWIGDHAEVEIAGAVGESAVLHLERARADQQCFLSGEHVSLHYRGTRLWPDLERRLRRVKLGATTLEALAEVVDADEDVKLSRDRLPRASSDDQATFDQKSLLSTWGSTETWSQFFAVAEISRGRLDSLDIFERGTFIQHCDRDCLLVVPKGPVPMVDRVAYPWLDRVRQVGRSRTGPQGGSGVADADRRRGSIHTTDLRERDVVMGSTDKLEQAIAHAVAQGVDDMLFLSCTCVPFVTGEDVESIVKRWRPRLERPFFFLTTTPQSSVGVFREVLVKERQAMEAAAPPPDPRAVNLIGYARDPALEELTALLAEAGVRVNAVFIPQMNFAAVKALPGAAIHVLYPNALWQSIYDQLLFESRIRAITPPGPFGVRATTRWLAAIVEATGGEGDAAAIVERAAASHRDALAAIRAEAAAHRLAFVVVADEVHRLCDPSGSWGVPLVQLVEELGFGVDVMIRAGDRHTAHTAAKAVHAMFAEPARHTIKAFADPARLTMLLETGAFDAVYSDHLFDRRITSAGKAQFSLQEFEKGIAGAVRTGRRLLRICKLPLYRRYGRYLPPDLAAAPPAEGAAP